VLAALVFLLAKMSKESALMRADLADLPIEAGYRR
jgi:hypothetical protein